MLNFNIPVQENAKLTGELDSAYKKTRKRHILQHCMIITLYVDVSRQRLAAILDLNIPGHQND